MANAEYNEIRIENNGISDHILPALYSIALTLVSYYSGLPTTSEDLSVVVLSFLCYFFSFRLAAFCDFSAIFHWISLIFGQLVDNNL